MKRKLTDTEKVFAHNATMKGLVSKVYKELKKLSIKNTVQSKNAQKT